MTIWVQMEKVDTKVKDIFKESEGLIICILLVNDLSQNKIRAINHNLLILIIYPLIKDLACNKGVVLLTNQSHRRK